MRYLVFLSLIGFGLNVSGSEVCANGELLFKVQAELETMIVCGYKTNTDGYFGLEKGSVIVDSKKQIVNGEIISLLENKALGKPKTVHTSSEMYDAYMYVEGKNLIRESIYFFANNNFSKMTALPIIQKRWDCSGETCIRFDDSCVYTSPEVEPTNDLSEIESYLNGENKGNFLEEGILEHVQKEALLGNKRAQEILSGKEVHNLVVDGVVAQSLSEITSMISYMLKLKCL